MPLNSGWCRRMNEASGDSAATGSQTGGAEDAPTELSDEVESRLREGK